MFYRTRRRLRACARSSVLALGLLLVLAVVPFASAQIQDWADMADLKPLMPTATVTTTTNGAGVNTQGYYGKAAVILDSAACTGTSPTLNVAIQDSADNVNFAQLVQYGNNVAFSQVTTAASQQELGFQVGQARQYIRAVATLGGTSPSCSFSVEMMAPKLVH